MTLSIINPLEYPDWDALLATSDRTTFFQTAAWARVLADSYGYRPLYFTAIEEGRLTGLIPVMEVDSWLTGKRGVSLPFTDLCHPVVRDPEVFKELLAAAAAHGRKAGWKSLEIRGGQDFLGGEPAAARMLFHTLALTPAEAEVSRTFRGSTRRNIRKAEKEGVAVRLEHSRAAMEAFYRLHCGTRKRHGLPPQPWAFFENIFKYVVAAGKGFVIVAEHLGRKIAAAVFFHFRGGAIFKFGASDRNHLGHRPNNLILWEAIRWACGSGMQYFSFGRTEQKNQGLLQFKQGWGAAEEEVSYYSWDVPTGRFRPLKALPPTPSRLFRALPIPALRMAGSLLYRHVG